MALGPVLTTNQNAGRRGGPWPIASTHLDRAKGSLLSAAVCFRSAPYRHPRTTPREQHVDLPLLLLHRLVKPVRIRKVRSIALHTCYIPTNRLYRLIQLVLPPASDEHVCAFFHEQLCRRKRHA